MRVRPWLPAELAAGCPTTLIHDPSLGANFVSLMLPPEAPEGPSSVRVLGLDRVLPATAGQGEVFDACAAPLVADCIAGRDVALATYGNKVGREIVVESVPTVPDKAPETRILQVVCVNTRGNALHPAWVMGDGAGKRPVVHLVRA